MRSEIGLAAAADGVTTIDVLLPATPPAPPS
jgi:hypothetical protein